MRRFSLVATVIVSLCGAGWITASLVAQTPQEPAPRFRASADVAYHESFHGVSLSGIADADLIARYEAAGGRYLVCPICFNAKQLDKGDLVIDGGNSRFTDDFENEKLLRAKGIGYLDCGVSGGIWGLKNGYGLMVGGAAANVRRAMPIFSSSA